MTQPTLHLLFILSLVEKGRGGGGRLSRESDKVGFFFYLDQIHRWYTFPIVELGLEGNELCYYLYTSLLSSITCLLIFESSTFEENSYQSKYSLSIISDNFDDWRQNKEILTIEFILSKNIWTRYTPFLIVELGVETKRTLLLSYITCLDRKQFLSFFLILESSTFEENSYQSKYYRLFLIIWTIEFILSKNTWTRYTDDILHFSSWVSKRRELCYYRL